VARLTSGGGVRVRTPRPEDLRTALERAGLAAAPGPDGALLVAAPGPAQVGDIAFAAGVPLHELTAEGTSLEEAFLALTTDAPELTE
jgi:ABC-2 type transport system ATP-binding protein